MKKRMEAYLRRIDGTLQQLQQAEQRPEKTRSLEQPQKSGKPELSAADLEILLKEHLQQVEFFQQERLMHLLVTMLTAILTMMSMAIMLIAGIPAFGLVTLLLLVLLFPYILHYYRLENGVQKMYGQYDKLLEYILKNKDI